MKHKTNFCTKGMDGLRHIVIVSSVKDFEISVASIKDSEISDLTLNSTHLTHEGIIEGIFRFPEKDE